MLGMSIDLDFDLFDVLEEKMAKLVETGGFAFGMWDTGSEHYSGYSFPALLSLLSRGTDRIPPRPVLQITTDFNPVSKSPLKKSLNKYLSLKSGASANMPGEVTSRWYAQQAKEMFGNTSYLESNAASVIAKKEKAGISPSNNPLVWTGDLKNHMQFKYGNMIKTVE